MQKVTFRAIIAVIVVALIAIATILLLQNNSSTSNKSFPTPTAILTKRITTPTPKETFCTPSNLQATITTQGAAGNIYGTLEIKNISSSLCIIQGNQFITASFSATNLGVVHKGSAGPASVALRPNQIVYSQIHFPNGPQCQGPSTQTPVTFFYTISPTEKVIFKPYGNLPTTIVTTCVAKNQITNLDVWSISIQPVQ